MASLNKLCWLAFLLLSVIAVAVESTSFDSGYSRLNSIGHDEDLFEDNEFLFDSESARRQLKADSIVSLPLSTRGRANEVLWHFEKLGSYIVPSLVNLSLRKISVDVACPQCGRVAEFFIHAILMCKSLHLVHQAFQEANTLPCRVVVPLAQDYEWLFDMLMVYQCSPVRVGLKLVSLLMFKSYGDPSWHDLGNGDWIPTLLIVFYLSLEMPIKLLMA
ncbi:hypothetical protein JRO89_XS06G0071000 [Xanthoceras sorbifolium]|uniref:Reverse transcriptase zinc-binding domain-containing protein n=1 Tax=Xanthoceras sorbifolium TaxID=99658 RepID=A0ABQ8HX32_9ROSI|nr:hypothetical protein JRO89_XS06G0071000 [Xanthoceras sorbifolium]